MRYLKKRVVLCIGFYLLISLCGCGIKETPSAVIKEKNENHSFEETENVSEQEVHFALTGGMNISQEVTGAFFYTEPVKTDEDYQLYFKKKNDAESWDDQYTTADMTYKFPDVREKNRPIGKPLEVYFVESMEFSGDAFSDFLFVAAYEVNGKYCFDTRVYTGSDTGYEVDQQMSEYLNEKYPDLENGEYPLANGIGDALLTKGVINELREIYDKIKKEDDSEINSREKNVESVDRLNKMNSEEEVDIDGGYKMELYTTLPNESSCVRIRYPVFSDSNLNELNKIIYEKVESFAQIDTTIFSANEAMMVDYQSAVTLQNKKMISIIFWGESYMETSAFPRTDLYTMNIDLRSMQEIYLKDLYDTGVEFQNNFFKKAFFPTNPITSYDESKFTEMLKLQTPEYTLQGHWYTDSVCYFLKPDGIVLSMSAVHATGSDHFEAQLKYEDIEPFYLLKQKYWED